MLPSVEGGFLLEERIMWGKFSAGIVMLAAVIFLSGFQTDELRSNWKYAGGTLPGNETGRELAFFDEENIQYLSNGNVRVWMKAVDASEIDRLVTREKDITIKAMDKMAKSYYPPYFLSNPDSSPSADAYIEMIEWEEAANRTDSKPRAKLLYEINCREKTIQTISAITYKRDGTSTFASDFDKWSSIVPETTGDALRRILCK
jgi:hypothetical protein